MAATGATADDAASIFNLPDYTDISATVLEDGPRPAQECAVLMLSPSP